jgi:hypothetical protein
VELAGPGSGALPESGNLTLCIRPWEMILLIIIGTRTRGRGRGARQSIFLFSLSLRIFGVQKPVIFGPAVTARFFARKFGFSDSRIMPNVCGNKGCRGQVDFWSNLWVPRSGICLEESVGKGSRANSSREFLVIL